MEHGYNDIGIGGLGGIHPLENAGGIDDLVVGIVVGIEKIHAVLRVEGQRHVVDTLGKGDKGELDAVDLPGNHAAGGAGVRGVGAHGVNPGLVEQAHGGGEAVDAVHNGIGVGGLENVEADVTEVLRQNFRCIEVGRGGGAAGIGRGAQHIELQIAHGDVGTGGVGRDGREGVLEVIGEVILLGGVDLALIGHDVAHGGQGGGDIGISGRRSDHFFLLLIVLLGILGLFLLPAGAAPDNEQNNHDEYQKSDTQHNSLLDLPLPLHFQALEPPAFQHLFIALIFIKLTSGHADPSLVNLILFIIQYFSQILNEFFGFPPTSLEIGWGLGEWERICYNQKNTV